MVKPHSPSFSDIARYSLVTIFITIVASGCTSTRVEDFSASSTYAGNVPPQNSIEQTNPVTANQLAERVEPQQINNQSNNDKLTTNTIERQIEIENQRTRARVNNFYSDANRSGVILQETNPSVSQTKSRSFSQPIETSRQTRVASLSPSLPNVFQDDKERSALERIQVLDAQIKHSKCEGGWANQPDKLDASEITAGHPFYMEIRMRHTPMLPVGHTYIAYGRLSPSGKPQEERLIMLSPVGGYGGAAIAAALPMPGVLKPVADDCRIKPIAAYRVTLSAVDYEKLLLRVYQAHKKSPAYALFAYNCNHFASDIAASVGILPPKNKYLPALKYIYGIIEANKDFSRRKKYPT